MNRMHLGAEWDKRKNSYKHIWKRYSTYKTATNKKAKQICETIKNTNYTIVIVYNGNGKESRKW